MLQPIWAALRNAASSLIADAPKHLTHELVDRINERRHINERRAEAKERAELAKPTTAPATAVPNPRSK